MSDLRAFAQTHTAARLRAAASRGALSHALIFSGAGDRVAAARYAAAALECTAAGEKPCLTCAHCRKVMADIHPDVTFVRDPEHKELSADVVRAMRADTVIRPNEGARKIYVFEDCSAWNERGQNILLKTIEEGPPYCAFLFCAENSAALLQTIRSRCVEVKLGEGGAEEAVVDREEAAALCRLIAEGGAAERAAFLVKLETAKRKRDELGALFESARLICADALLSLYGASSDAAGAESETVRALAKRVPKAKLVRVIELLDTYRRHCTYNVGAGVTLGGFAAELEELLS